MPHTLDSACCSSPMNCLWTACRWATQPLSVRMVEGNTSLSEQQVTPVGDYAWSSGAGGPAPLLHLPPGRSARETGATEGIMFGKQHLPITWFSSRSGPSYCYDMGAGCRGYHSQSTAWNESFSLYDGPYCLSWWGNWDPKRLSDLLDFHSQQPSL